MKEIIPDIFTEKIEEILEFETDKIYKLEFSFTNLRLNNLVSNILQIFDKISKRDNCTILISMDELQPIIIKSKKECLNIIERIKNEFLSIIEDDSSFYVEFTIFKNIIENKLSFYSLNQFKRFLFNMDIFDRLRYFNYIIEDINFIHFIIYDESLSENFLIQTDTIKIASFESLIHESVSLIPRQEKINKQRSVCNVVNNPSPNLIPEDFFIIQREFIEEEIEEYLLETTFALLLAFIFDYIEFNSSNIHFRINGYKPIDGIIEIGKTKIFNIEEMYKIYKWIYEASNVVDKIGLARNILTFNIVLNNRQEYSDFYISDNTFASISSGYNIYLKENVNEYIEIKNKVSEFIINQSLEASKIIKDFVNSLKNSNYLYITVFLTFIVFNAIEPDKDLLFSKEIILISLTVLAISLLYLILNVFLINADKKRFIEQYRRLKRMYSDLLSDEDISVIFLENEELQDIEYIDYKKKLYFRIWLIEIILIFITIIIIAQVNSIINIGEVLRIINLF